MRVKIVLPLLVLSVAVLLTGCASHRPVSDPNAPEPPVSEIPDYPDTGENFDVSARVAVYPTLWIAGPIEEGLRNAGYAIADVSTEMGNAKVELPDFIIEPLSFKHSAEPRRAGTWLFTRITLQVRKPARVADEGTVLVPAPRPRVFQVFAKRDIGQVVYIGEAQYRENVAAAVDNLMRIPEFRRALEK